jgi:hypothetical protein
MLFSVLQAAQGAPVGGSPVGQVPRLESEPGARRHLARSYRRELLKHLHSRAIVTFRFLVRRRCSSKSS